MRSQRGPMLIAALMALVLLLSAGWVGSWPCEMGGSSDCACPCGTEAPASEGARDAAERPDCCASEEATDVLVAGVVGGPIESWAPHARLSPAPRRLFSALRPGLQRRGASRGPPQKLSVFLCHQALLL